jgi:hypothetical protein
VAFVLSTPQTGDQHGVEITPFGIGCVAKTWIWLPGHPFLKTGVVVQLPGNVEALAFEALGP